MNKVNRLLFGGVIGLMAGFSFQAAILPAVAERVYPNELANIYSALNMTSLWLIGIWVVAGALAARYGGARNGSAILSLGGLIAGALLGLMMMGGGGLWSTPLIAGAAGCAYGWGAGFLVGSGFGPAVEN